MLPTSLSAFLEQEFPGGTRQGSDPRTGLTQKIYQVMIDTPKNLLLVEIVAFTAEQALCEVLKHGIRDMVFAPLSDLLIIAASGGIPVQKNPPSKE